MTKSVGGLKMRKIKVGYLGCFPKVQFSSCIVGRDPQRRRLVHEIIVAVRRPENPKETHGQKTKPSGALLEIYPKLCLWFGIDVFVISIALFLLNHNITDNHAHSYVQCHMCTC